MPRLRRFRSSLGSCNQQSKIYSLKFRFGVLAQLVERLNGIEEVTGSNPVGSKTSPSGTLAPFLIIVLAFYFPVSPAGGKICNIKNFLEKCPTLDPAYSQIRKDFIIRREGVVVEDVTCVGPISQLPIAQYTDELIVLQNFAHDLLSR